ncbi:hypothetical protein [Streptomyces sp. NPDC007205]|uniref:hypothetical protein n=1 Tax=Streptomyces sp. NPDC007205 TaxID=3154316 RepID=UPI0034094D9A
MLDGSAGGRQENRQRLLEAGKPNQKADFGGAVAAASVISLHYDGETVSPPSPTNYPKPPFRITAGQELAPGL